MKVWITKYALTDGIKEIEAESCAPAAPNMIRDLNSKWATYYHGEGKEWHRDKFSAKEKAYAMVAAKIKSIDKQRERLLRLQF